MFAREFEALDKLVDDERTATERLLEFTEVAIGDVKRMLGLMPLAYEFMSLAFRRKFVQEAFKRYINQYMDVLVPLIQQGIDSGEFREVDAFEVAVTSGAIFGQSCYGFMIVHCSNPQNISALGSNYYLRESKHNVVGQFRHTVVSYPGDILFLRKKCTACSFGTENWAIRLPTL